VVVEQPTYGRTLLLLQQAGAELVGAPLEADGVDPAAIESACGAGEVKLAHVIPNFHNPAGCTLSLDKRSSLVQLAADNGFTLFEDDPYRLICFEKARGRTMLEMDSADRVIHASSFSKSVSPGVRVGYLVGPADQIATLAKRANETYISPNMLAESIVFELCRSGGLDENLKVVNAALRERRDALVEALHEHIPEAEFVVPAGGYFLWLDLKDDVDSQALLAEAKEEGVTFVAGPDFMIEGGSASLRLSFAPVPAADVDEGIQRLARALERLRAGTSAEAA
jgi:DNA-binding transcriptional MocR family regulator